MKTRGGIRITVLCVLALGLLLAAALAHAGDGKRAITVSAADDGDDLVVAVSEALAKSVVGELIGSELSCDGASDGEFVDLLRELDRRGRGSRASMTTDDDTLISAKRKRKTVKLDIRDQGDNGEVEVVMPWLVAECLLGRDVVIDDSLAKVRVKIKGADGETFTFKVD